ncbi:uncharacterized protein LOC144637424 isoform X2 [Oculina patagonica]
MDAMLLWRVLFSITLMYSLESSESIPWPGGTYGIPKPASGCPWSDGFVWREGWRSQSTHGRPSNSTRSPEFHLDGIVDNTKVKRSFCIKDQLADDGKYCIYKGRRQCPPGLTSGDVFWDDEDKWNSNNYEGTLPDGRYDHNTWIYFCCKTDGDKDDPVLLPAKSPFYLLAYESAKCQMVKWAMATVEWIYYDTEDWNNGDGVTGAYPHEAGKIHPTIYYCHYRGCNETLTADNGTFQSPNYPKEYPDGQYCSWSIMVNTTPHIHLMFTNFSLQNENNTDALYVYDGANATGEVLGVFYGSHPPPSVGIFSMSNNMFVIFKSDNQTGPFNGFSASYFGVNKSELSSRVTTTSAQTTKVTTSSSPVTLKTITTLEVTTSRTEPQKTITERSSKEDSRVTPTSAQTPKVTSSPPITL